MSCVISFPYKQSPASRRNVSRAPRPAIFEPFDSKTSVKLQTDSDGTEFGLSWTKIRSSYSFLMLVAITAL